MDGGVQHGARSADWALIDVFQTEASHHRLKCINFAFLRAVGEW